jgi:hypothetical protein
LGPFRALDLFQVRFIQKRKSQSKKKLYLLYFPTLAFLRWPDFPTWSANLRVYRGGSKAGREMRVRSGGRRDIRRLLFCGGATMVKKVNTPRKAAAKTGRTRGTPAKRIADIIAAIEQQLTATKVKASVGDYIRLLQMQKEFVKQKPRKIQVTWVEPKTAD